MARGMTMTGQRKLDRKLKRLSAAAQRRMVRRPTAAALSPIIKAAKQNVPKDKGNLKRSIGKKVKLYKSGVWGGAGPRTGAQFTSIDDEGRRKVPAKYGPLVEFGTDKTAAQPFMRKALDQNRSAAMRILREGIRKNLQKEAKKK